MSLPTNMIGASERVVYGHILSAACWLFVASLYGVILAAKLWAPEFLTHPLFSFGRIRPVHTGGVLLGWLTLAFMGLAYLVVYRSARRPLWSPPLAWVGLTCVNLALLSGSVTLSLGITRGPLEYREWITPIAAVMALGVLCHGLNVLMTLLHRRVEEMYISNWFILGAYIWLPILYVIAYLPGFDRGVESIVIQGYFMHDVLGLWFTPMAVGITYWALPRLLHKPIYSYALGVLAFWTNLVFYTMLGAHHFILSPVPWWLVSVAALLGIGMMIPVWSTVFNFTLTMRGSWALMRREPASWFILAGTLTYGLASLQGTFQGLRDFSQLIHFTHYTVAHAHWAAYGFASFLAFGAVYALLPRLTGVMERTDLSLAIKWHFWLALIGLSIYFVSMTISGTIQGLRWSAGLPFVDSLIGIQPYMLSRLIGGSLMAISHGIFLWVIWRLRPAKARAQADAPRSSPAAQDAHPAE
ncbi:MAG: cbb3-type cytochrome c oxidase subunit I [Mangrovicoccus sp.]|nr:cbb3-type cytochrome c oxidase subunit I [Mangrovicoccus sp.]